ncbi:MAG: Ig-like domain-containing protein [Gammaproteobacteria bacterium]|nr:Ig-like domain-containing protein [Gammaproteobacteria bacterium]
MVIVFGAAENGDDIEAPTQLDYGGVSIPGGQRAYIDDGDTGLSQDRAAFVGWLFESQLPADGAHDVDVTFGGTEQGGIDTSLFVTCLEGAEQVAPTVVTTAQDSVSALNATIAHAAGDWTLGVLFQGDSDTDPTWSNGESELVDSAGGGARFSVAEHTDAAAAKTAFGATFNSSARATIVTLTTAPALADPATSYTPAHGAVGVSTTAQLVATFGVTMQKGSGNVGLRRQDNDALVWQLDVGDSAIDVTGSVVTITQPVTLDPSRKYWVEWDLGAFQRASDSADVPPLTNRQDWRFSCIPYDGPHLLRLKDLVPTT